MKTPQDPRHKRRQKIIKLLFTQEFHSQRTEDKIVQDILKHADQIQTHITKIAPSFPIEKINKIDVVILKLAVYELLFEKKQPPKVVVDEAIELAKEFGGDTSPSFVNGALGRLLKLQAQNSE